VLLVTHLFSDGEGAVFSTVGEPNPESVAAFSQVGGFQPMDCYASFSPSSAIPIFDSRYRRALRDSPSNRAA